MKSVYAVMGKTNKGGFFTSIGLALGASKAAALGTGILATTGLGLVGASVAGSLKNKGKSSPTPSPAPTETAESLQNKAEEKANEEALKKRRARTKTVLTGPRGLLNEPETSKPGLKSKLGA